MLPAPAEERPGAPSTPKSPVPGGSTLAHAMTRGPATATGLDGEVMAEIRRQRRFFLVSAVLAIVMAGLSIAGWTLYHRADRARADAIGELAAVQRAERPDLDAKIADLESSLNSTKATLVDAEARLGEAEQKRVEAEQARAKAEAEAAGEKQARLAADARSTVAETGRSAADAKAAAAETARTAAESALAGLDQTRRDLEARLARAEQARDNAEGKSAEVERGRISMETRAVDAERQLTAVKEQLARLTDDVQGYRRDLEAARDAERRTAERLELALAAASSTSNPIRSFEPTTLPGEESPATAGQSAQRTAASPQTQPSTANPAAVVIVPGGMAAPVPISRETVLESESGSPLDIRVPIAARPTIEELLAVSPSPDAPAADFLAAGEYQLVKGNPGVAVELVEKAIAKGGARQEYLKSHGWALLRAGRPAEAEAAFKSALGGFEEWSQPPRAANPDHWTAAYFLGRIDSAAFVKRWEIDAEFGRRLACLPWFYIGQRREMEGRLPEAREAYRASVEYGQAPNAYPIWRWSQQRLGALQDDRSASRPAR